MATLRGGQTQLFHQPRVRYVALRPPGLPSRRARAISPVLCSAAAGANPLGLSYRDILSSPPSKQKPLPPAPLQATFADVLPWLLKLAVAEKAMWWRIVLAFGCLVISKGAGLMCPVAFKAAIDSFSAAQPQAAIAALATKCLLLYGLCDILKNCARELQAPLFTPVSQAAARRVAFFTFAHVLNLDIRFHLDRRTGRLSRILERGTRSIQMLYRAVIFTFAPTALELIFVCAVLAKKFSPLVGAMVLATFAVYVTWSITLTQLATEARKRVNELDNATSSKAVDALLSFETVALFNNQRLEVAQYNTYLKGYFQAMTETDRLAATLNSGQAVVLTLGLMSIMITALRATGGVMSAGDLVMIQGLLLQLWAPLQFLGWFYRELRSSLVDMEDFFAILRTQSNLNDGTRDMPALPPASLLDTKLTSSPVPAMTNAGARNGTSASSVTGNGRYGEHAEGRNGKPAEVSVASTSSSSSSSVSSHQQQSGLLIDMKDVKFGYTPERRILHGVSLRVQPGRSLAVVGSSGSGKSTILKLLTRLYDVNEGSVTLNGVDVRDLKLESLRDAVAVVPQDTMLFNDTLMQNIRYGRPSASDEQVIEAAKMARLHEAVMRMPDKYETVVGERGLKLSGGEKQRVAIARAFLREPRLLICDEATSALDSETEAQIMASLTELAQGRTSVFVAHRLSTIRSCDRIVVLRDGVVVEQGSHDQLMALNSHYARMYEMQAREAEEEQAQAKRVAARAWPQGPGSPSSSMSSMSSLSDMHQPVVTNGYRQGQGQYHSHQLGDAPQRHMTGEGGHQGGPPGVTDDEEEEMRANPWSSRSLGDHEPSLAVPAASVMPAMYPLAEEASGGKGSGSEEGTGSSTSVSVNSNRSSFSGQ